MMKLNMSNLAKMSESELKAMRLEIRAAGKADANPGYISWESWPAGWKRFHSWQARASVRNYNMRLTRRALAAL